MNNSKFSTKNIFIWAVIISFLVLVIYYWNFVKALINVPFALSPIEGINLWAITNSLSVNTDNELTSFGESVLYITTISAFLKIQGYTFNLENLSHILFLGRILSFLSLIATSIVLFLAFFREKIKPIASIAALTIMLSTVIVQSITYQARGELIALFLGLFGIYNFMPHVRKLTWARGIYIGSLITLPFLFTHNFVFFSFAFACFLILLSVKNTKGIIRLLVPFILLIVADLIISPGIESSSVFSFFWNADLFTSNFDILYSWAIFATIIIIALVWRTSSNLRINPVHPCNSMLAFSVLFNIFCIGSKVNHSGGWLVTIISLTWMFALFLDKLLSQNHERAIQLFSCLIVFVLFLTPVLEPLPRKLLIENPQLILKTKQWTFSHQPVKAKDSHGILKAHTPHKVLAQDNILALLLESDRTTFFDPNLLFRNTKKVKPVIKLIQEQTYEEIVLSENPTQIWPQVIVKKINQFYVPTKKILVNGSEGLVYEPKIFTKDKPPKQNKKHKFSSNTFATFTPI